MAILPNRRGGFGRQILAGAGCALLLCLLRASAALEPNCAAQGIGAFKGFKVAQPFPAPHEKQTKSLLEGGLATPARGGYVLSEGVTLRVFSESNTVQLVVRSRECFYNSSNHTVHSAGPLQMQTADGKFSIEGKGFYWEQTNSSLFISNQVHTVIMADLFQASVTNRSPTAGPDTGPLSIWSEHFAYDGISGQGVWSQNVRVSGTNLDLTSALLTANVPMKERQVRSLLAQTNVVIDYHGLHGTGGQLTYAPDTGLIRLWDQATWKAEQREGSGDELIIDRSNQVFQVNGHAWLNLTNQSIGETGLLSFSNSPPQNQSKTIPRWVEITCPRYEIRTNSAFFQDQVLLQEHWNGAVRGRMTCGTMKAVFVGTNELDQIIADRKVVITEGDKEVVKRFTGGHAVYTHTNATLELTQNPEWQAGARCGKGELVRLDTQSNELLARGNAWLRLPANELASQFASTNHAVAPGPSKGATNQVADIYCQEYTLGGTQSVFRGGVYATHPEMNWSCEQMIVKTPPGGMTNVFSDGNVVFDLLTGEGKMHGTADKAVYSFGELAGATNGPRAINEVRLIGTPAVLTNFTKHQFFEDTILVWDRERNKLIPAGGHYRMQGWAPALPTNTFQLPNQKRKK